MAVETNAYARMRRPVGAVLGIIVFSIAASKAIAQLPTATILGVVKEAGG